MRSSSLFALLVVLWWAPLPVAHADAGRLFEMRLTSGPHPPGDAPDVIAHLPSHYDVKRPLDLVVFLHGFDGCSRALLAPNPTPCRSGEPPHRVWNLAQLHEAAGTNTVLLVPQLAYLARTAKGHRFTRAFAFDAMLRELLSGALGAALGIGDATKIRTVTLVAHSAGYAATAAILRDPQRKVPIHHVALFDALYAGWDVFASWANADASRRLVSLHTAQKETTEGNRALLRLLRGPSPLRQLDNKVEDAVRTHERIVARVKTGHGDMPREHFTEVLRGLLFEPMAKKLDR